MEIETQYTYWDTIYLKIYEIQSFLLDIIIQIEETSICDGHLTIILDKVIRFDRGTTFPMEGTRTTKADLPESACWLCSSYWCILGQGLSLFIHWFWILYTVKFKKNVMFSSMVLISTYVMWFDHQNPVKICHPKQSLLCPFVVLLPFPGNHWSVFLH